MGCVMMWFDPEGGEPEYEPPFLQEWDDPQWVRWELDHLGEINLHGQEILDNMADAQHLGPTHGAPCEYFENEIEGHLCIQRQGGFHQNYNSMLTTTTWYTGPGVLLSKQEDFDVTKESVEGWEPTQVHAQLSQLRADAGRAEVQSLRRL